MTNSKFSLLKFPTYTNQGHGKLDTTMQFYGKAKFESRNHGTVLVYESVRYPGVTFHFWKQTRATNHTAHQWYFCGDCHKKKKAESKKVSLLPKIKVLDGFIVEFDPDEPQNPHVCFTKSKFNDSLARDGPILNLDPSSSSNPFGRIQEDRVQFGLKMRILDINGLDIGGDGLPDPSESSPSMNFIDSINLRAVPEDTLDEYINTETTSVTSYLNKRPQKVPYLATSSPIPPKEDQAPSSTNAFEYGQPIFEENGQILVYRSRRNLGHEYKFVKKETVTSQKNCVVYVCAGCTKINKRQSVNKYVPMVKIKNGQILDDPDGTSLFDHFCLYAPISARVSPVRSMKETLQEVSTAPESFPASEHAITPTTKTPASTYLELSSAFDSIASIHELAEKTETLAETTEHELLDVAGNPDDKQEMTTEISKRRPSETESLAVSSLLELQISHPQTMESGMTTENRQEPIKSPDLEASSTESEPELYEQEEAELEERTDEPENVHEPIKNSPIELKSLTPILENIRSSTISSTNLSLTDIPEPQPTPRSLSPNFTPQATQPLQMPFDQDTSESLPQQEDSSMNAQIDTTAYNPSASPTAPSNILNVEDVLNSIIEKEASQSTASSSASSDIPNIHLSIVEEKGQSLAEQDPKMTSDIPNPVSTSKESNRSPMSPMPPMDMPLSSLVHSSKDEKDKTPSLKKLSAKIKMDQPSDEPSATSTPASEDSNKDPRPKPSHKKPTSNTRAARSSSVTSIDDSLRARYLKFKHATEKDPILFYISKKIEDHRFTFKQMTVEPNEDDEYEYKCRQCLILKKIDDLDKEPPTVKIKDGKFTEDPDNIFEQHFCVKTKQEAKKSHPELAPVKSSSKKMNTKEKLDRIITKNVNLKPSRNAAPGSKRDFRKRISQVTKEVLKPTTKHGNSLKSIKLVNKDLKQDIMTIPNPESEPETVQESSRAQLTPETSIVKRGRRRLGVVDPKFDFGLANFREVDGKKGKYMQVYWIGTQNGLYPEEEFKFVQQGNLATKNRYYLCMKCVSIRAKNREGLKGIEVPSLIINENNHMIRRDPDQMKHICMQEEYVKEDSILRSGDRRKLRRGPRGKRSKNVKKMETSSLDEPEVSGTVQFQPDEEPEVEETLEVSLEKTRNVEQQNDEPEKQDPSTSSSIRKRGRPPAHTVPLALNTETDAGHDIQNLIGDLNPQFGLPDDRISEVSAQQDHPTISAKRRGRGRPRKSNIEPKIIPKSGNTRGQTRPIQEDDGTPAKKPRISQESLDLQLSESFPVGPSADRNATEVMMIPVILKDEPPSPSHDLMTSVSSSSDLPASSSDNPDSDFIYRVDLSSEHCGYKPEHCQVSFVRGWIEIQAEQIIDDGEESQKRSFYRRRKIPDGIDADTLSAEFEEPGILVITGKKFKNRIEKKVLNINIRR